MNLQQFLNAHPVDNLTEEVVVSPRFRSDNGETLKFTIRAMTSQDFDDIRKSATEIRKGRKVEFDAQKFNLRMVINHTVTPDFKDAESIRQLGCRTPEEYVQKVLLAGEVTTLAGRIQALSGFDTDMETLVEEAKKLIVEGDADANYAYYALHELHVLPGKYMSLPREERAFVMACINERVEREKKEAAKRKRK